MRVVVAHPSDAGAAALVARWRAAGHRAGLLTPADLSVAGWAHDPAAPVPGRAVVEGARLRAAEIEAVVTRLAAVVPADLPWIDAADRAYAAAEMQAFLLAWLTALPCPVLNRPSPSCLAGPAWTVEEWLDRARRLGLPARGVVRGSRLGAPPPRAPEEEGRRVAVDVVGERSFVADRGAPERPVLERAALRLAADAGAELLRVEFLVDAGRAPEVAGVGLWVNLHDEQVAEAVGARCGVEPAAAPLPALEESAA